MPLWQDVRRMAELRLQNPATPSTHFLGAVVLQAQDNQTGSFQPRLVIDGQQRLTTLQLLMDATAAVLECAAETTSHGGWRSSPTTRSTTCRCPRTGSSCGTPTATGPATTR